MERKYINRKALVAEKGGARINCGSMERLELHHVVPLEIGGNDTPSNMVPLCYECHKAVTHHQDVLKFQGRGSLYKAGGRPKTQAPADYAEILGRFFTCEIGTSECKQLLGVSDGMHLQDVWYVKDYKKSHGIKGFKNNVDIRRAKGSRGPGGWIEYDNGTRVYFGGAA